MKHYPQNKCSRFNYKKVMLVLILFILAIAQSVFAANQEENSTLPQLETITVSAQKRTQKVQDIADSITVLDEILIEDASIDGMEGLSSHVPNLEFYNFGSRRHSITFMRGVMSNHAGEPATGYYVDGVNYSKSFMFDFPLFDVEQIEILRGPQGTLYGRNTMGGLINVMTRKPDNNFSTFTSIGFGSRNLKQLKWNLRAPIIDDLLSFSFSGVVKTQDGYMDNTTPASGDDGRHTDEKAGRFKLRYRPTDKLDMILSVDRSEHEDGVFPFRRTERNAFVKSGSLALDKSGHYSHDFEGISEDSFWGASLKTEYIADFATLTAVTGYRDYATDERMDSDFSPLDMTRMHYLRNEQTISQEIRLVSPENSSSLQWVAGLYFFHLDGKLDSTNIYRSGMIGHSQNPFSTSTGEKLVDTESENQGAAVFGQTTWSINQRFDLTLGMRYEYEESEMEMKTVLVPTTGAWTTLEDTSGENDFSAFLPKLSGSFHLTEEHMLYATVAAGHRSGGFSASAPVGKKAYDEESSVQYEIGSKSLFLHNSLMLNMALFYNDIDDEQISLFDQRTNRPYVANAGESHRLGVEAEARYTPFEGFEINGGVTWLEAEFDQYNDPVSGADYKGNTPFGAPEFTYNIAAQYRYPINAKWILLSRVELNGIGDRYLDNANQVEADPYELVNIKIGFEGDNIECYFCARNLLDEDYVLFENTKSGIAEDGEPLTAGVTLNYRF